jgi:hypothetical protein
MAEYPHTGDLCGKSFLTDKGGKAGDTQLKFGGMFMVMLRPVPWPACKAAKKRLLRNPPAKGCFHNTALLQPF